MPSSAISAATGLSESDIAGLAIFLAIGCGAHEEEKPATPGNQEQKPIDGKTDKDKDKDKDKDAQSDAKSDDSQSDAASDTDGQSDAASDEEEQTCDCQHGTCENGSSTCTRCEDGYFGQKCDSNETNCEHGTPSLGPDGDGNCESCDEHWDLAKNCADTTSDYMADTQGNVYRVTKIGEQIWMAENMATDQATDGTPVTCDANTDEDPDFVAKYGCLYTWEDAMKVCPKGWHLSKKADFKSLLNAAGKSVAERSQNLRASAFASGADAYGFSALPAGYYNGRSYRNFGYGARFWSATEHNNTDLAYSLYIANDDADLYGNIKYSTFSVRCLKD